MGLERIADCTFGHIAMQRSQPWSLAWPCVATLATPPLRAERAIAASGMGAADLLQPEGPERAAKRDLRSSARAALAPDTPL
eukprot:12527865-Alexandrium_andersonii.AAC.1